LRLSLSILILALATTPSDGTVERRLVVMGTALEISVTAPSRREALEASEAAVSEIARVESLLSTWKEGGPLARLNTAPAGAPVRLPSELFELLESVFAWSDRTAGVFEPAILPLVTAWGLRTGGRIPPAVELGQALEATGHRRFRLDSPSSAASKLQPGAGIDEGAWGKGYALDRAADVLRAQGVSSAVLDLGGQVLSLSGVSSDGDCVGLADPRDRSRLVGHVVLRGGSLSTSGNSERAMVAGGRRIGHLLDPRTGQPAPDFGSVTVFAPSGLVADLLSTAFFVLGPEKGPELSRRLRAEGVTHEVLYLVERESALEAVASDGFVPAIEDLEVSRLWLNDIPLPAPATRGRKKTTEGRTP